MKKYLLILLAVTLALPLCAQNELATTPVATPNPRHPGLRIAFGGGYASMVKEKNEMPHMIAKDDEITTKGSLKNGYALHLDVQYFFSKLFGIGIQANMNHSSIGVMEIDRWYKTPVSGNSSHQTVGTYFDYDKRQSIYYLGPSLNCRIPLKRFTLLGEAGIGGLFYRASYDDKKSNDRFSILATSSYVGGNLGVGGEYSLGKNLAVGLKIATNIGSVRAPKAKDKQDFNPKLLDKLIGAERSVSSLMVTAFLSFHGR